MFFYQQALGTQEPETVDIDEFTYPGPRPRSRETAILMLADGCESSVRARRPQSKQDVQETVDYIFETRLRDGQLDESGLTLNDLRVLRETFLAALQAVFHVRIAYPGTPGQVVEALHSGDGIGLLPPSQQSAVVPGKNSAIAVSESEERATGAVP
jgi:hypothetical protein